MDVLLEMDHVTKLYGNVIGLNDVNLQLPAGVYGLLGPIGSGKTTFINLIMGQLRPSLGRVRVMGHNPSWDGAYLRQIGLCPATDIYLPQVTGLEWVVNQICLYGIHRRRAAELALAALQVVKMEHACRNPLTTYSLGMRQRCKLAQAIAHSPDLLILDEPFNGLDPVGRIEMTQFLRQWVKQGRSLIMASHILHEIEAVECSFLLLTGGRLLASGTLGEVRNLLREIPNQIRIRSPHYRQIAAQLVTQEEVLELKVDREHQMIVVSTESPAKLATRLSEVVQQTGFQVSEVRSEDESLQSLFSMLMQLHRGER
jgi:ABC-2 type transport system ATP-binding protein